MSKLTGKVYQRRGFNHQYVVYHDNGNHPTPGEPVRMIYLRFVGGRPWFNAPQDFVSIPYPYLDAFFTDKLSNPVKPDEYPPFKNNPEL